MRVKVTTEIDINLKMMFEATKGQHGKTFKDILESGISTLLKEYDPVGALHARIELREKELQEDKDELARLRILEPQQKRMAEYEEHHKVQLQLVEEWFDKDPEGRVESIERGVVNWQKVAPQVGAISARQAQNWVMEVVNSWKVKHEAVIS